MEFEKLQEIIADVLNIYTEDIRMDTTFVDDLGADSLDIFQIIMGIEEEFDIEIDNDDAENNLSREVVSPMVVRKPKSKRKLFDDQTEVADQESTNNKAAHLGSPPLHNVTKAKLQGSPLSSSCASSSPGAWWRN